MRGAAMSGAPAVFPGTMNLIILIVICLLACAFLLYVLLQWMRETKRKPAGRFGIPDARKDGASEDKSTPSRSPEGIGRK